jgi:hypothetical protein
MVASTITVTVTIDRLRLPNMSPLYEGRQAGQV